MKTLIILAFMTIGASAYAQQNAVNYKLNINIKGLESATGVIKLEIARPNGEVVKSIDKKVSAKQVSIKESIPAGEYMVQYYHDANNNGEMDKMLIGIPKEGYGFSNNPDAKYGPPDVKEMTFAHHADTSITIKNIQW